MCYLTKHVLPDKSVNKFELINNQEDVALGLKHQKDYPDHLHTIDITEEEIYDSIHPNNLYTDEYKNRQTNFFVQNNHKNKILQEKHKSNPYPLDFQPTSEKTVECNLKEIFLHWNGRLPDIAE